MNTRMKQEIGKRVEDFQDDLYLCKGIDLADNSGCDRKLPAMLRAGCNLSCNVGGFVRNYGLLLMLLMPNVVAEGWAAAPVL